MTQVLTFIRDLLQQIIAHPFWSAFVVLVLYCCGIVMHASLSLRRRGEPEADPRKLGQISFPHPRNLFDSGSGWKLVDTDDIIHPTLPSFSPAPDIPGGIVIGETRARFAMDHAVDPPGILCGHLRYRAKYSRSGAVYALVEVLSNDKSKRRQVYLAYAFGDQPPTPYLDGRNEWRIEDVGTVLDNGWRLFDHSLRKDVQRTFGSAEEGWSYVKLVGIRIRNALTISPIEFYAADAAVGSEDDSIS